MRPERLNALFSLILTLFTFGDALAQHIQYSYMSALTDRSVVLQYRLTTKDIFEERVLLQPIKPAKAVKPPKINYSFTGLGGDTFLLRASVTGLMPETEYQVSLAGDYFSMSVGKMQFKTLPSPSSDSEVSIAIGSCMHYERFYMANLFYSDFLKDKPKPLNPTDSLEGYPVLPEILKVKPRLFISNGDNVYYDHPRQVKNVDEMRAKWHQQFKLNRMRDFMLKVPIVWNMDDHDFRGDDSDTTAARYPYPDNRTAMGIFSEQAPISTSERLNDADAGEGLTHQTADVPYRKLSLNKAVDLFILDSRRFRSPIAQSNDTNKTQWGKQQRDWLISNLKSSKAKFKVIITPTPMVGPDDAYKKDNHTNKGGYSAEGQWFFNTLKSMGLNTSEVIIITGDRHWQYHSLHPTGYHEIATGAMVTRNARFGRKPGDPKSTDPTAEVKQFFLQPEPTGGFCLLKVHKFQGKDRLEIQLISETGKPLYKYAYLR